MRKEQVYNSNVYPLQMDSPLKMKKTPTSLRKTFENQKVKSSGGWHHGLSSEIFFKSGLWRRRKCKCTRDIFVSLLKYLLNRNGNDCIYSLYKNFSEKSSLSKNTGLSSDWVKWATHL